MSSTNRGYERHKTDYYVTPIPVVKEFLNEWFCDMQAEEGYNTVPDRPDRVKWLDPCAGGDSINKMSYADTIKEEFGAEVVDSIDIREDSRANTKADYFTEEHKGYDVIISNPPFFLAKEFISKALLEVERGGYVVMLLRLNFLGSKDRKKFFEDNMPERIYVHSKRICFTDDGKTDSIEYAHFVWKNDGIKRNESIIKII